MTKHQFLTKWTLELRCCNIIENQKFQRKKAFQGTPGGKPKKIVNKKKLQMKNKLEN